MLKRALRAIMNENMSSLLSDIAQLLLEMYQAVPQAAMLDLAKQVGVSICTTLIINIDIRIIYIT